MYRKEMCHLYCKAHVYCGKVCAYIGYVNKQ